MVTESEPTGSRPVERVVSAHTPGPWEIGPRPTQIMTSLEAAMKYAPNQPYVYLMLASTDCDPHPDRSVANARLIAAAPDLLAAAQECMDCELGDMACVGSMAPAEHALGLLQAAIARAVGANA